METVNFSGQALSAANGQAITSLDLLIINLQDVMHQYRGATNETGHFSIDLAPGTYDIYFSNGTHMPTIKAGVSIKQNMVFNVQLPPAEPVDGKISGQALLPGGAPASGHEVELLNGDASKCLSKVNCDDSGSFEFSNCVAGYHLIRMQDSSGKLYTIPMPVPGQSVSIQITLADERPLARAAVQLQQQDNSASTAFAVCKRSFRNFLFTGGTITALSGAAMSIQGNPMRVNIYDAASPMPFLYKYAVFADCRSNPFVAPAPAQAQYYFTDKTGDIYSLFVFWPTLQYVSYNSDNPDIIQVTIQGLGVGDYWNDAAACQ